MENKNNKPNPNTFKLWLLVHLRYFCHANIILNILATTVVNLIAGLVVVGFSSLLFPLILGNHLHFIYMFLIFSVVDILIRYLLYATAFQGILKTRGFLMFPYYLITFYTIEIFLDLKFVSFISIFLFSILFYIVRSWVSYVYLKIISLFKKSEGEGIWLKD